MGVIEIEGMHFYAYIGHFEAERIVGNRLMVNLRIETDCQIASISDDLSDALNYQQVYELVKREMAIPSHLLEHAARRILDAIYIEFPGILNARIKISKLNPPMGGQIDKVSVTLEKESDNIL